MQYVLLIYQPSPFDPKAWGEEGYQQIASEYAELTSLPNVTPGLPMGLPNDALTVRVQDGEARVADGPYVSEAGAVGGYMVVDVADRDEALAIAARIPAARLGGSVEVRPAQVYW